MKRHVQPAIMLLLLFTLITGVFYPLAVSGIAQIAFPYQANGSILYHNGVPVGSALVGQEFTSPTYFWGRLSATSPTAYNSAASTGSNYGPLHPALLQAAHARMLALRHAMPEERSPAPVDLVTSSASGLDPHISIQAAYYQVPRVAFARGISEDSVKVLVQHHIEPRTFGFLGEPRVNVLAINLALDAQFSTIERTR